MSQALKSQEKQPAKGLLSQAMSHPRCTSLASPSLSFPSLALQESPALAPLLSSFCPVPLLLLPFSSPNLCPLLPPSAASPPCGICQRPFAKERDVAGTLPYIFAKFNPLQTLTNLPAFTLSALGIIRVYCSSLQHREEKLGSLVRFYRLKLGKKKPRSSAASLGCQAGSVTNIQPAPEGKDPAGPEDDPMGEALVPIWLP